jgi:hypothetical protein
MVGFAKIHDAPLDQLLRWWDGVDPPLVELEDEFLDEVAFALTQHRPVGVAALKRCLGSVDETRRGAALDFLAYPGVADEEVHIALLQAFSGGSRDIRYRALWGFIHLAYFPLGRDQLVGLLEGTDERMAALAMVYLSRALPAEAIAILGAALGSPNPRMREYACDEIGDRDIGELSERMRALLADPDEAVVASARCNLEFFSEGPAESAVAPKNDLLDIRESPH